MSHRVRMRTSKSSSSSVSDSKRWTTRRTSSLSSLSSSSFSVASSSGGRFCRRIKSRLSVLNMFKPRLPVLAPAEVPRGKPKHTFHACAGVAVICVRLCRMSQQNLEKERGEMLSLRQELNLVNAKINTRGIFDMKYFRADKENHLSQEARRVLLTSPKKRTDRDTAYLQVALRNIDTFTEYPTWMQEKLCQVAWFERYESDRTIVKEGDPPRAFYFILSGSVDVTERDFQYDTRRTLVSLQQGMSFGELAVITRSRRQATVSSQTRVELLCISGADFEDIFMAGRKVITDPVHDSFIRITPVPVLLVPTCTSTPWFILSRALYRQAAGSD